MVRVYFNGVAVGVILMLGVVVGHAVAACTTMGCTDNCLLYTSWCEKDGKGVTTNKIYDKKVARCYCTNQTTQNSCVLNMLMNYQTWDNCVRDCASDDNCSGQRDKNAKKGLYTADNVGTECKS